MAARKRRPHLQQGLHCVIVAAFPRSLNPYTLACNVDDIRFFCQGFVLDIDNILKIRQLIYTVPESDFIGIWHDIDSLPGRCTGK